MTGTTTDVVTSYLLETGWHRESEGTLGSMWRKGQAETVLPRSLNVGSSLWLTVVTALAQANEEPADELARRLIARHEQVSTARSGTTVIAPRTGLGRRVELELHLTGPAVTAHETSAYDFGRLVMRAADSVKELVKSNRGTRHESRNLRVVGGPTEGSVQFLLREPDYADPDALLPGAPETAEGQALAYLSTVLAAAEAASADVEAGGTLLEPHLAPLTVGARAGLARLAEVVLDAGWTVEGAVRRGDEEARVYLSLSGAWALQRVARENLERRRPRTVTATFDSWSWSRSELEIITDELGSIRVAVPMSLQEEAAELVAHQSAGVEVRLEVFERVTPDSGQTIRTSYLLIDVGSEEQPYLLPPVHHPDELDNGSEDAVRPLPELGEKRDPWGGPNPPF